MAPSRPIQASISSAALAHNLMVAKRHAAKSKVLAVIKANAYGHGLLRAAAALRGADGFAMLDLSDAVRLREAGFADRIVLLEGFFRATELAELSRYRLAAVVHRAGQMEMLEGARLPAPIDILLKLNSGMNRLGFPKQEWRDALERARRCASVSGVTLMTHFACADDERGIGEQLAVFERCCEGVQLARSMANSATILRYPQAHGDWVRPGIMLYGSSPFADQSAQALDLKPAMTLASEIIAVQDLEPGDAVGYGATFRADRPMRIGVVACGYADGYPRHCPSGTPVLVDGRRTSTVGLVSMDMLMVDLTYLLAANVGSKVVLWGEGLPVDEVATHAGTVSYELLCALAPRVPIAEVD
ncbi:MAG: alanine racemase [Betaproteobacteria bacterium]|nr:alanine racemase [Betaproteobacteria bacterium]